VATNDFAPTEAATLVSPPDLYSFVIDLRPGVEAVLASFRPSARKMIRRGQRAGMSVRSTREPHDLEKFNEVLLHVTRGGTTYEVPKLALLQALMRAGFGRLYVLEHQGRIVGGTLMVINRYAQCCLLAYDRVACGGLSGYVLYWGAIMGEIEAGVPFMDMGAQSLSRQPGLVEAKRSFYPFMLPAYRYEIQASRWRANIDDGMRWLRRHPASEPGTLEKADARPL
jgi:hypothetical protein